MGEEPIEEVRVKEVKRNKLRFGRIIMVIGILVYIIMFFHAFFYQMIKTYTVTYGSIEEVDNVTGYVIRNEKIIKADIPQGTLKPVKNEGEKAAKGAVIATVHQKSADDIQKKINDLENKINGALANQAKNNIGARIFSKDIRNLDEETNRKVEDLCVFVNDNDFGNAVKVTSDINNNLRKRAEINGQFSPANQYVMSLIKEKKNYETNLAMLEEKIAANETGIVSYNIDGFENTLIPGKIPIININQLKLLDEQRNNNVNKQTRGVKIVDNYECYIAIIFKDSQRLKEVKNGQVLDLRITDIGEDLIPAYVDSITDKGNGNTLMSLRINQKVEELIKYRKVNISIVWADFKGLKIPVSSLIYVNGKEGVMAVDADYARFKQAEVINKNKEFAIVKENVSAHDNSVSLYDEIIFNGANVKEGRQIRRWNQ